MVGYLIEQELGNRLPSTRLLATVLTMVEVDPGRPGIRRPHEARRAAVRLRSRRDDALQAERGWTFKPDGDKLPPGRAVAGAPPRIVESRQIAMLLAAGCVVVCAGGGGIPTMFRPGSRPRSSVGVEAVIDKDLASERARGRGAGRRARHGDRCRRHLRRLGHAAATSARPRDAR